MPARRRLIVLVQCGAGYPLIVAGSEDDLVLRGDEPDPARP